MFHVLVICSSLGVLAGCLWIIFRIWQGDSAIAQVGATILLLVPIILAGGIAYEHVHRLLVLLATRRRKEDQHREKEER
jgi:hypothetical protein